MSKQDYSSEMLDGERIYIGGYVYSVTVYDIGRFNIWIRKGDDDLYGYYIAGDKKTKFEMQALLEQIEGVVKQHAPNNRRIREVIEKYWPVLKWRTKQVKNMKKSFANFPD